MKALVIFAICLASTYSFAMDQREREAVRKWALAPTDDQECANALSAIHRSGLVTFEPVTTPFFFPSFAISPQGRLFGTTGTATTLSLLRFDFDEPGKSTETKIDPDSYLLDRLVGVSKDENAFLFQTYDELPYEELRIVRLDQPGVFRRMFFDDHGLLAPALVADDGIHIKVLSSDRRWIHLLGGQVVHDTYASRLAHLSESPGGLGYEQRDGADLPDQHSLVLPSDLQKTENILVGIALPQGKVVRIHSSRAQFNLSRKLPDETPQLLQPWVSEHGRVALFSTIHALSPKVANQIRVKILSRDGTRILFRATFSLPLTGKELLDVDARKKFHKARVFLTPKKRIVVLVPLPGHFAAWVSSTVLPF